MKNKTIKLVLCLVGCAYIGFVLVTARDSHSSAGSGTEQTLAIYWEKTPITELKIDVSP